MCLLQMNTTADDGLENFPEAGSAANIGIMLVRKAALGLAKVCKRFITSQNALNSRNFLIPVPGYTELVCLVGRSGMRC